MTDQTDRKSAEILAALDKLAENGMPFIDVVKQGGFASFKPVGAKPLPTEPVQVHEAPGAAYWNEVRKMTDQTDRIKQMAQEAGLLRYADESVDPVDFVPNENGMWVLWDDAALAKFAALVAEDCLRVLDDEADKAMDRGLGNDVYHLATWTDEAIRARYAIAKPPEAG